MAMSKIIIIDDDSTFVNLLSEELTLYGQFEVLTATKKKEEIAVLKEESVDIVLVDIDAGNIDGLEFLSYMSTAYPHIPSIVMTRKDHLERTTAHSRANKDFILGYMVKPAHLQGIGGAIVEGLHCVDENDFSPGIAVVRLLYFLASEQKTCRVRVKFGSKKQGFFDFNNGILQDAFCDEKDGEDAAVEMISWPPLSFELEPLPPQYRNERISQEILDTILVSSRMDSWSDLPEDISDTSDESDSQKKIKLFIIDDSRIMRKVIANVFADDETIEIVGEAANGEEALRILPQLNPDVVTLDVQMPVMDGITTLKHMMIQVSTPTVMLSAYTREGAVVTYDALKYGAVDFVAKPSNVGGLDLKEQAREISKKVHLAAEVELEAVKYIRAVQKKKDVEQSVRGSCDTLVAIGAAEGGYGTLLKIIPHLSPDLPSAYLVMLHASPQHVDSFVDYLGTYCSVAVERAKNNASIEGGVCYLASGEEYLTVHESEKGLVQHLSSAPFVLQRGAINMLMFSVAEAMQDNTRGVILSGLGRDGKEGLEEINRVGGSAIVQDTVSCLYKEMVQSALKGCPTARVVPDSKIFQYLS